MASLQARKDFPRQIRELVAVTGTNEVTIKVDARTALAIADDLQGSLSCREGSPYSAPKLLANIPEAG